MKKVKSHLFLLQFFILEKNIHKSEWPYLFKDSILKIFRKLSFYLSDDELKLCTPIPEHPVFNILNGEKAFDLALKKYSKKLEEKFKVNSQFI